MSDIPFKNIPAGLRSPLFYAELDPSKANTNAIAQRALLIGQKTAAGTLAPNVPVISQSQSDTRTASGPGSILAGMIDAYRANDLSGEMWVLPLSDDGAAVKAAGTITFTGPTTAPGTLALYIAGRLVSVALATAQTATQVATTVVAAITATAGVPVVATSAAGVVTLTALNGGECGNDIDIRVNYKGTAGGEVLPAGLGATIVAMSAGATNPVLTTALANLQDRAFDFIVCSLTDATSLAAIAALLNDATGRWSWQTQVYGGCWIAKRGTAGALASFATALNNQHIACIGFNDSPSPAWKWAAAFAGASAVSLRADPAVPLQDLTVVGILAPPIQSEFGVLIRNFTLLNGGVATWTADASGAIAIDNIITTYVTNPQGQADDSYLEVETMYLIAFLLRDLSTFVTTTYARKKLAADGTRLAAGSNAVTPSTIRAGLIARYRTLEEGGFVQGSDAFAAGLTVQKNSTNPNRVDVLYPPTLIDQLRVFAVLFQFRNQ
jgi:phage tail sheath gpL-like